MRNVLTIVKSRATLHQNSHAQALMDGMRAIGMPTTTAMRGHRIRSKFVACWGWRLGEYLRDCGHEVLVMERGYVGDRFSYSSLGWNGLNGLAEFPEYPADNGERFALQNGVIKPWKDGVTGTHVLIMGQVPTDKSLRGRDLTPWYEEKAREVQEVYGLPVLFRPHPDVVKRGLKQAVNIPFSQHGSLSEALENAAFSICFNSNSSVDSILAGVPCVIGDKGSMAYSMCSKQVGDIFKYSREKWAHALAWKQWSLEEIRSGYALQGIAERMR